jgi:hypothetical protein
MHMLGVVRVMVVNFSNLDMLLFSWYVLVKIYQAYKKGPFDQRSAVLVNLTVSLQHGAMVSGGGN